MIVEPVVGNMGCVRPRADFRRALRESTRRHGAVLIFDEVMTGFRVAYGGAQSLFGIEPDLTTLGKIIGGGLPMGAYGGRAEIMDHVLPAGKVFQAGTLSGNPLATAAGIATLTILRDSDPYAELERLSARLAAGLAAAATAAGVAAHDRPGGLDDDPVLQSRAGDRLGHGRPLRHAALRPLLLGHDRAGHLPAVQPVRGPVRLHGPHGSGHRRDDRRGAQWMKAEGGGRKEEE